MDNRKKAAMIILLNLIGLSNIYSQSAVRDSVFPDAVKHKRFNYKPFIIPAALIGYGLIGLESDELKSWNFELREEVTEGGGEQIKIDDFTQYAPAASVYVLNAFGVKGKNNLRDRSVILVTSYAILSATVFGLKAWTKVERPDGSSRNSFPSGHTASAFAGAEFLRQEYKDQSIWYGIAGYTVAAGTGIFRIYNNRHWLTDVAAGAGIGILSTKIAYWANPYLTRKIFGNREKNGSSLIMPMYDGQHFGLAYVQSW